MLTELHIAHHALIDKLTLPLKSGMTVITGETGAGKSMLLDALNLVLGGRDKHPHLRSEDTRTTIALTIDLADHPRSKQWLHEHDLDDDNQCLLRRTCSAGGRSRAYINGTPVNLTQLREFGNEWITLHSQHQHHALLKPETQRQLLDAYAGHNADVANLHAAYQHWQRLNATVDELAQAQTDREARIELLRYHIQELDALDLETVSWQALDEQQKQLAGSETRLAHCHDILAILNQDTPTGIVPQIKACSRPLTQLASSDNTLADTQQLLEDIEVQLTEVASTLQHYIERLDTDPSVLSAVEEQLSVRHELARKHRIPPEQLLEHSTQLKTELASLERCDETLHEAKTQAAACQQRYYELAQQITKTRQQAAKRMAEAVSTQLKTLGMPHGQLHIMLTPTEPERPTSHGLENISFNITTNPGLAARALQDVASGGELSRISLAIEVVTAHAYTTPVLVFDEVDVGIGGSIAEIVGQQLAQLSQQAQVLCITHLPQIAALADHHLQVEKRSDGKHTSTQLYELSPAQRIEEIARMLGGITVTEQTRAHAREMLSSAFPGIPAEIFYD